MTSRGGNPMHGAGRLVDPGVIGQLRLAWRLLRDPRVGGLKYLVPALLVVYVASPVDPIPDFLIGLGQIDDVGVVVAGLLACANLIPRFAPRNVVEEHLRDLGMGTTVRSRRDGPIEARYTVH